MYKKIKSAVFQLIQPSSKSFKRFAINEKSDSRERENYFTCEHCPINRTLNI